MYIYIYQNGKTMTHQTTTLNFDKEVQKLVQLEKEAAEAAAAAEAEKVAAAAAAEAEKAAAAAAKAEKQANQQD